jgi:polyisoprenoid-binding protein YceI
MGDNAAMGPDDVEVLVRTTSEGPLAGLGHDLTLRVGRVAVEVSEAGGAVRATMAADSLELLSKASARDKRDIEKKTRRDVLRADRHPEILFQSTEVEVREDTLRLVGDLTLCGHTRSVELRGRRQGGRWTAEGTIRQPDFGIRPYRAFLGGLRVSPEVSIVVSGPAEV